MTPKLLHDLFSLEAVSNTCMFCCMPAAYIDTCLPAACWLLTPEQPDIPDMLPCISGPGPRGMPRGYPRGGPGPMMYPPMMPQRMGGRGSGRLPRMGPYDMAYPPPPGPMMMGGRGPMDGFRPRLPGMAVLL